MRAILLVCLMGAVGCAQRQRLPPANETCEQSCVRQARECRAEAIEESSGGWGLKAVLNRTRQEGLLSNCAESKSECLGLCSPRGDAPLQVEER